MQADGIQYRPDPFADRQACLLYTSQRFGSGRLGGSLVEFSLPEGMNSQIGDRVVLSAEASALHFFDPETGRRLSCAAIPVSE